MRIAVLSDQHIHTAASAESWELAQRAFSAAAKYDHVVLAGDTFDSATAFANDHSRVRDALAKLGLWRRDRITVVVGNHDVFHTPHRGTKIARARELAHNRRARLPETEGAFYAWATETTRPSDHALAGSAFPLRKKLGHVALYAADTAPRLTLGAANGFWWKATDAALRDATVAAQERRLLVTHHPPKRSRLLRASDLARGVMPLAFPPASFSRLESFVEDLEIDAAVCGHIHRADSYQWPIGRTKIPAYMVGRSGGLHRVAPVFGALTLPARGAPRWVEVAL